jgi:hypothetical protein
MTRRERLEAKVEKREAWADSATREAQRRFDGVHRIADNIPFGQPILVGHHSEKHARRDAERIHSGMSKGIGAEKRAADHVSKAGGIQAQLDGSIFSDDPDAIEALEAKAAGIEARADRCSELNRALKREMKKGEGWLERIGATDQEKRAMENNAKFGWAHQFQFPAYHMSNLRANARRCRERIKSIRAQQAQTAKAEAAGGTLVEIIGEHAKITFDDFPGRDTINTLKASGFHWSRPCWYGPAANLPDEFKTA